MRFVSRFVTHVIENQDTNLLSISSPNSCRFSRKIETGLSLKIPHLMFVATLLAINRLKTAVLCNVLGAVLFFLVEIISTSRDLRYGRQQLL